jgi:hypothetical protein
MNLMSSMANTLVGSVIAIVSVAPARLSGTIWYLCAVSDGISLMMPASISNCVRLMEGNAVLLAEERRDFLVLDEPELDEVEPELAAVGLLVVQRLLQLRRRNALLFEQQLANPDGHRLGSW